MVARVLRPRATFWIAVAARCATSCASSSTPVASTRARAPLPDSSEPHHSRPRGSGRGGTETTMVGGCALAPTVGVPAEPMEPADIGNLAIPLWGLTNGSALGVPSGVSGVDGT
eukprot:scaffold20722_cov33-Tisochrysis_lutea.AAC.7